MPCNNQIPFCKVKCCACDFVGREHECPHHKVDCGGENVPTFGQWLSIWHAEVEKRRIARGSDNVKFTNATLAIMREFMELMGYTDDDRVSVITRRTLKAYADKLTVRNVSKLSKINAIRRVFDKWLRILFEDVWELPVFDKPDIKDDSEGFKELTAEQSLALKKWYRALYGRKCKGQPRNKDRLFVMFMYRYAMRNGDVTRLRWSNIQAVNGKMRLTYTPHKTELSSKREVKVWMSEMDAADLADFREDCGNPPDDACIFGGGKCMEMRDRLNRELRDLGFLGSKGLYMLRKICMHETFKKHGREAVFAISGDNKASTIFGHYVDRSSYEVSVEDID